MLFPQNSAWLTHTSSSLCSNLQWNLPNPSVLWDHSMHLFNGYLFFFNMGLTSSFSGCNQCISAILLFFKDRLPLASYKKHPDSEGKVCKALNAPPLCSCFEAHIHFTQSLWTSVGNLILLILTQVRVSDFWVCSKDRPPGKTLSKREKTQVLKKHNGLFIMKASSPLLLLTTEVRDSSGRGFFFLLLVHSGGKKDFFISNGWAK